MISFLYLITELVDLPKTISRFVFRFRFGGFLSLFPFPFLCIMKIMTGVEALESAFGVGAHLGQVHLLQPSIRNNL